MDIFGNFSKLSGDKKRRRAEHKAELDFSYGDIALEPLCKTETKTISGHNFSAKALIVIIFCVLITRIFWLQVMEGAENQKMAEGNRIRPRLIEAQRGLITDKNGVWLARNKPSFALAIYPSDLPKNADARDEIFRKVADISSLPFDEVKGTATKNGLSSLDKVVLKEDIPHDDALLLEEKTKGLNGVFVDKRSIRDYKVLPGLSLLLGYTGIVSEEDLENTIGYYLSDRIGKIGLEAQYESYLKGTHGVEQIEVDSQGNIQKVLADSESKEPVSGDDLVLNIDSGLQQKSAEALKAGIDAASAITGQKADGGVVGVLDVNTGAILSLVSLPDFNNNLFATKIPPDSYQSLANDSSYPMFNRAIQGTYPPGSISKIILASAGLQEGAVNINTAFDTPAEIKIGDYVFPDWKDHGITNIERAIAESNNVFFYSLGGGYDKIRGIGINNLKKYWQLFGLGEKTGIDLPSEASGLLPDPEWKEKYRNEPWYIGDTYHVSIGQGDLLVTPIQMLRATAVIANGGKLLEPRLAKEIVDPSGKVVKEFVPKIERENFIDPNNLQIVAEGMRLAVTDGSARNLADLPVPVAGKTGTAQFFDNQKTHAWFTCYAPYNNPQIAVTVLVEGGGGGHEVAAPVAKEILNYYFTR